VAKHSARCPRCGNRLQVDTAVDERIICPNCQASLSLPGKAKLSDKVDPLIGQTLGEFEIVELLGRGGMGAVYKARQPSLGRPVAIKVLPRAFSRDASFIARFDREARAAAAVSHPNIIEIHAIGQDRGYQYIAMEFVDGESLGDVLKREGRLPADRALDLMKQVAAALAKAHVAGVLHRDIKPSNILLTSDGLAKVADFGLAKHEGLDASVTHTGQALGTPLYMPPEAARGERFDARSDLYSLGATFYQVLAGNPPFLGSSSAEIILKQAEAQAPPLARAAPDAPPALCRVIHRLLRKNPGERYPSAEDLLQALIRVEARVAQPPPPSLSRRERVGVRGTVSPADATRTGPVGGVSLPRVPLAERREAKRQQQRRLALIAGGCGAAALVLVVVLVLVIGGKGEPPQSRTTATAEPTTQAALRAAKQRERNAEALLKNARRAAANEAWLSVQSYLDRLKETYAKTKSYAANRAAIRALRAKADAALKRKPTPPKPTPPKPTPPKPLPQRKPPVKPEPPPDDDERWTEWVDLFDGKTLSGWRVVRGFAGFPEKGGKVRAENGRIVLERGERLTAIAWTGAFPRADYEVKVDAMRVAGQEDFSSLVFPVEESPCTLILGGFGGTVTGVATVDGKYPYERRGTPIVFERGRWYTVRLRVTKAKIEAWIDDQRIVDFERAAHTFGRGGWVQAVKSFGLFSHRTEAAVRNIRLRRLKPEEPKAKAVPWKVYTKWPFDAAEAKRRQKASAHALGVEVEQGLDLGNGVKMTFVLIPAGEFMMGRPPTTRPEQVVKVFGGNIEAYQLESPQHRVKINRPFWLGKYEVTQEQWEAVMRDNPSHFKDRLQNPVEQVSWDDCLGLLHKLSAKSKKTFRLATEAEWEYACRAGTPTEFYFGDSDRALGNYAWFGGNSGGSTQAVGRTKPNAWGLHDMHGNVWEWCEDWYAPYRGAGQTGPKGPGAGDRRVLRGGGWGDFPRVLRSAFRNAGIPGLRWYATGLRVVVVAAPPETGRGQPTPRPDARARGQAGHELEAKFQVAAKPAEAMVKAWDFAGAATALAKLNLGDIVTLPKVAEPSGGYAARLATRRDEVRRLTKLKAKMIAKINTAKPPLTRRSLLIPGINADLAKADEKGITAKLATGKTQIHEWKDLSSRSVQQLVQRSIDRKSADDWLAGGILSLAVKGPKSAERHFERGRSLGAKIDRYLDPLTAAAFARAKALLDKGEFKSAESDLTDLGKKYATTPWLAAHKDDFAAAREAAKAGIAEAQAEKLYAQAVRHFKKQDLWALKPVIDKLKAGYGNTRVVTDATRKPSFAEMAKAVAKLGKFLTVRQDGKGDFKSIQAAIDAAPPNSLIEIQDNGVYNEHVVIHRQGVVLRGKRGRWPVITLSRQSKSFKGLVEVGAARATIERLVLVYHPPADRSAACVLRNVGPLRLTHALVYIEGPEPRTHRHPFWTWGKGESKIQSCILIGPGEFTGQGRTSVSNCIWKGFKYGAIYAAHECQLRFCTVVHGGVATSDPLVPLSISDSILEATVVGRNTRIDNCNVFKPGGKPGKGFFCADPQFRDPANFDYRLKRTSPCRRKASDGGDIGCRYTPEMLEMLRLALELRRKGVIKF